MISLPHNPPTSYPCSPPSMSHCHLHYSSDYCGLFWHPGGMFGVSRGERDRREPVPPCWDSCSHSECCRDSAGQLRRIVGVAADSGDGSTEYFPLPTDYPDTPSPGSSLPSKSSPSPTYYSIGPQTESAAVCRLRQWT